MHYRTDEIENETLALFIHGFLGSRYGTWGRFPDLVYRDFPAVDVGVYEYPTGWRWRAQRPLVDFHDQAVYLADAIRVCPYRNIFIFAHSLGGLLAESALARLMAHPSAEIARIRGLFLFAVPHAGSVRVPSFLRWFSRDARVLAAHSDVQMRIAEEFSRHRVVTDPARWSHGHVLLPSWIVTGRGTDRWVDTLSSFLPVPPDRMFSTDKDHRRICKPSAPDDDVYTWVTTALTKELRYLWDAVLIHFGDAPVYVDAIAKQLWDQHQVRAQVVLDDSTSGEPDDGDHTYRCRIVCVGPTTPREWCESHLAQPEPSLSASHQTVAAIMPNSSPSLGEMNATHAADFRKSAQFALDLLASAASGRPLEAVRSTTTALSDTEKTRYLVQELSMELNKLPPIHLERELRDVVELVDRLRRQVVYRTP